MPFRFDIAFSFASPHRDTVRAIAEIVAASLGRERVFFDEWYEHEILGDDMEVLLQRFYHEQSLMVVADLSEDYTGRPWCRAEAKAIRALRYQLDPARDEIARLRLLYIRLGPGSVPGVFETTAYLDGLNKSKEECAQLILMRHTLLMQRMAVSPAQSHIDPKDRFTPPPATPEALLDLVDDLSSMRFERMERAVFTIETTARQSGQRLEREREAQGGWGKWKADFDHPDRRIVTGAARLLSAWIRWRRYCPVDPDLRKAAVARASSTKSETQLVVDVLFKNGHAGLYWDAWNLDSPNTYVLDSTILHDIALNNRFFNFVSFSDCYLCGACFDNSYLMGALFDRSDLHAAKFRTRILCRTSFNEANLKEADFSNSNCEEAIFVNASLSGATLPKELSGANLTGADLNNAVVSNKWWLDELRHAKKPPIGISWEDWIVERDASSRVPLYRLCVNKSGNDKE